MKPVNMQQVGIHATTIAEKDGILTIRYHETDVVTVNLKTGIIKLDNGGWLTVSTMRRMNQASNQFKLGYWIYSIRHVWYVDLPDGSTLHFQDKMTDLSFYSRLAHLAALTEEVA